MNTPGIYYVIEGICETATTCVTKQPAHKWPEGVREKPQHEFLQSLRGVALGSRHCWRRGGWEGWEPVAEANSATGHGDQDLLVIPVSMEIITKLQSDITV